MRTGVFLDCLHGWTLDGALQFVASTGAQCIEVGTFGEHVAFEYRLDDLLADKQKRADLLSRTRRAGLEISALGCYGNALHPDVDRATRQSERFRKTVELASLMGVRTVAEFAGCPGDSDQAKYPNWISCLALDDFPRILEWQWSERVLPYWKQAAAFCSDRGVQVAIEMYPGSVVYNPRNLLRLREAVGPVVGATFDPSHLVWQQIDIPGAIRLLGPAIHRVHMNDSQLRTQNLAEVGVVDTTSGDDWRQRAWVHRTLGHGQSLEFWKSLVTALLEIGYAEDLCIEQGDKLYDAADGIAKAAALIRSIVPLDDAIKG
jgi:sugar phosphate isomerase/epimerase